MGLNDTHSLSHTRLNCKYHIVFAPKYRSREFWCKGYYVDTVGKSTSRIAEYIQNQLKEDELGGQLTINPNSPFTGG